MREGIEPKSLDKVLDELFAIEAKDLNVNTVKAALECLEPSKAFTDPFALKITHVLQQGDREKAETMVADYLKLEELVSLLLLLPIHPKSLNTSSINNILNKHRLTQLSMEELRMVVDLLRNRKFNSLRSILIAHKPGSAPQSIEKKPVPTTVDNVKKKVRRKVARAQRPNDGEEYSGDEI